MNDLRMVDVDELRRNPEDGAYHCPKCDAPFTRRSNLRRHYGIHIRNNNLRCNACRKVFTTSEELQCHVLQCPRSVWNASEGNSSLENQLIDSIGNKSEPMEQTPAGYPEAFQSISDPSPQHDDFDGLFSSLTCASMSGSPNMSPFTGLDFTSSLGSTPEWSLTDLPASTFLPKDPLEDSILNARPRPQRFNGGIGRRLKSKEKPIYTRRQVEDMLDIVSRTFAARLEETIRQLGSTNGELWNHNNPGAILPEVSPYPFL